MRSVSRGEVDETAAGQHVEILAKGMPQFVESVSSHAAVLKSVLALSLNEFGYRSAIDPAASAKETWSSLIHAMQAAVGIFVTANGSESDQVEFRLADKIIRRPGASPTSQSGALNWITALWLCMICRERERIDLLAATPVDLIRASDAAAGENLDEYAYDWIRTWQAFWQRSDGVVDLILASMRGTDPANLQHFTEEWTLQIAYPPIEMLYLLTQGDADEFNNSLVRALELHRRFWSSGDRPSDPDGYVALGPLAIACLARDTGMRIDVESEYLPARLLDGTWLNEFPT